MSADFSAVINVRQGFGNKAGPLDELEPHVPFVGATKDFPFDCPKVKSSEVAVLMFQSRHVEFRTNVITINGHPVQGGIPTTDKAGWNGNVMLISSGVLKESGNVLHIESRNKTGGTDGNIDGFIIDNAVAMYKT